MNDGSTTIPTGRLAPTPSGGLHVGNLFASMLSWLVARRAGGRVVLRIEDLDLARSRQEYADAIMRDYERLGITWDNSDVMHQGNRAEAYEYALDQLKRLDLVYPCYCSRADLHAASAPHIGEKYLYAGTCRNLSGEEREQRSKLRNPAERLMVPDETITVHDLLQGAFKQNLAGECGDFIVQRSDGVFAYQLAVVVDDIAQGVTQVVRGVDLMDSAPQQLYLKRLLASAYPDFEYWHVPLMVDEQGNRLSKRDHSQSLEGIMQHFDTPEAFIGYLAGITGIAPTKEPISMDGLLNVFSLDALAGKRQLVWVLPD